MEAKADTYQTIAAPTEEVIFKEKKSKFLSYAFPITSEEEVKPILEALKKKYYSANHVCYAWQLGTGPLRYRANDDGEPNNSAGMPIYGQIQSFGVTNILVVVVRFFGGTKLGVGGLIGAYRTSAQMALQSANIVRKVVQQKIRISFDYAKMDSVMRIIKQLDLKIISQKMDLDCTIIVSARQTKSVQIKKKIAQLAEVSVTFI